jgi:hypothetical protein
MPLEAFTSTEGGSSLNAGSEGSATIGMPTTRVCSEAVESSTYRLGQIQS